MSREAAAPVACACEGAGRFGFAFAFVLVADALFVVGFFSACFRVAGCLFAMVVSWRGHAALATGNRGAGTGSRTAPSVVFFRIENSKDNSFVDLSLLKNKTYAGATLSNFLLNGSAGTLLVSLSLVQQGANMTALQAGLRRGVHSW